MDLKSLSQLGRIEKEISLSSDLKIKFHTLSVVEQQRALLEVPSTLTDDSAKFLHMQVSILMYATDSINNEKVEIAQLRELYSSLQYPLLVELFNKYLELSVEQSSILDELKKK